MRSVQNTQPQKSTPDITETPDETPEPGNTGTPTHTTKETSSHTHTDANNTYVTSSGRVSRFPCVWIYKRLVGKNKKEKEMRELLYVERGKMELSYINVVGKKE